MIQAAREPEPAPASPMELRLLGVRCHLMTIPVMHEVIKRAVERRERLVMVSQNLHSVYLVYRTPDMRELQEAASYVRIDGLPLVWFARLLGYPAETRHRTGWNEWLDPFMTEASRMGWRVFYLGSEPAVAAKGAQELARRFPRLRFKVHHGHFDMRPGSEENRAVVAEIRAFDPDVVIVGMGMPRQERWILENSSSVGEKVFLTAGACLDIVAGAIPQPPRWIARSGFYWLYRLLVDPQRLWRRYLVEPWFAVGLFILDVWRKLKGGGHRVGQ